MHMNKNTVLIKGPNKIFLANLIKSQYKQVRSYHFNLKKAERGDLGDGGSLGFHLDLIPYFIYRGRN